MKRPFELIGCVAALWLAGAASNGSRADDAGPAKPTNRLAPLERFVGEWVIDGRWSNGQELHARSVYEWGVGRQVLKARTYVRDGDREYQRYDAVLAWHPRKNSLFEISFSFQGEVSEYLIEATDADTLLIGSKPYTESQPGKVRQTIKFTGRDSFRWTVTLQTDQGWQPIMDGTWRRKTP
jgi:hypothetical protein